MRVLSVVGFGIVSRSDNECTRSCSLVFIVVAKEVSRSDGCDIDSVLQRGDHSRKSG